MNISPGWTFSWQVRQAGTGPVPVLTMDNHGGLSLQKQGSASHLFRHVGDGAAYHQRRRRPRRGGVAHVHRALGPDDGKIIQQAAFAVYRLRANARAGGTRSDSRISGMSFCSARVKADLLTERTISPSPVFQYLSASRRKPG